MYQWQRGLPTPPKCINRASWETTCWIKWTQNDRFHQNKGLLLGPESLGCAQPQPAEPPPETGPLNGPGLPSWTPLKTCLEAKWSLKENMFKDYNTPSKPFQLTWLTNRAPRWPWWIKPIVQMAAGAKCWNADNICVGGHCFTFTKYELHVSDVLSSLKHNFFFKYLNNFFS
jgi:hypothetical protein